MSSISLKQESVTTPIVESKWKKAGRFLGYAALGVSIIGAGMLLYNSLSGSGAQANIISNLEAVASKTVDLCQDQFFGDKLCKGNLGISRMNMPQVEGETLTNYVKSLVDQNVSVVCELMHPRDLTATQNEMHAGKVTSIVKAILDKGADICSIPVLVARNYVVDGHHRFAACSIVNQLQKVINVDRNITDVLSDLRSYPGVVYQGLTQSTK